MRWPRCARCCSTAAGRGTGSTARSSPCSPVDPDLMRANAIEPIWNDTKQHDLPTRSFSTVAQAKSAVDDALAATARRLQEATAKTTTVLRRAGTFSPLCPESTKYR